MLRTALLLPALLAACASAPQEPNADFFFADDPVGSDPQAKDPALNSYLSGDEVRGDRLHGSIAFPLGYQSVEDVGEVDDLGQFGFFDLALQPAGSPISLVVQGLASYSADLPDSDPSGPFAGGDHTTVGQLNLGLRHVWRGSSVQPYLGGGLSLVSASVLEDDRGCCDEEDLDTDTDWAGWVGGGVNFVGRSGFLFGIYAQTLLDAEVQLLGRDYDLEGWSVGLQFGYGF